MSVFIIRAFVKLREIALTNEALSKKFKVLEDRVTEHDTILMSIIKEIRNLIDSPGQNEKTRIGFRTPEKTEIDGSIECSRTFKLIIRAVC